MKNKLMQPTDKPQIITPDPDSQFRLRSCSACGGNNAAYVLRQIGGKQFWRAECQDCGHKGAKAETRHGAQVLWNRETMEVGA